MAGLQQLPLQKQLKQVIVIGSVDLDSQVDKYHTGVAHL